MLGNMGAWPTYLPFPLKCRVGGLELLARPGIEAHYASGTFGPRDTKDRPTKVKYNSLPQKWVIPSLAWSTAATSRGDG